MRQFLAALVVVTLVILGSSRGAEPAPEVAVKVSGALAQPSDWTVSRLKTEFAGEIKPVEYSSHGQKHTADSVSLLALLKHCGVPTEIKTGPAAAAADPKTKNLPLRLAVVVRAGDGYAATLSLAEMLPDFGNEDVWLALDMDGKSLSERDGPLRLIVPSDAKPGRWVHGITEIVVLDAASASDAKP
jgi:DMSO/TMAO reductase YedYZ molybdopterin-dependent catalytic subunit